MIQIFTTKVCLSGVFMEKILDIRGVQKPNSVTLLKEIFQERQLK